jgi:hypothetical protein
MIVAKLIRQAGITVEASTAEGNPSAAPIARATIEPL